jgi:hypothetical protein
VSGVGMGTAYYPVKTVMIARSIPRCLICIVCPIFFVRNIIFFSFAKIGKLHIKYRGSS